MLEIRCNMRKMGEAAGIPVSTLSFSFLELVHHVSSIRCLNLLFT